MTTEEKIAKGIMDLRTFHQQWVRARDMKDLKEWRRVLFGAVGVWRELERGLGAHRDVIRDRVNRLIAPGSTILWNPNLWDRDSFLTRVEARPFKTDQPNRGRQYQGGRGQGQSHHRHHSYAGPSTMRSPGNKRVMDSMIEAGAKLDVNVGFLHTMAIKQMAEDHPPSQT